MLKEAHTICSMHACTHCPEPGDTMSKLDPAGVKGHIVFREGSGNQALLHKHSDFKNTTAHSCTTTTSISPFLLGDSLSEGGKKALGVFMSLCWVCPKPLWSVVSYWLCAGGLLDLCCGYKHCTFLFFFFIWTCIISSFFGKSTRNSRTFEEPHRNVLIFITLNKVCSL